MSSRLPSVLLACTAVFVLVLTMGNSASAQVIHAQYTGVITSIEDPLHVFNNSLSVGGTVQGLLQYDPLQMERLNTSLPDTQAAYRYANTANDGLIDAIIGGVPIHTSTATPLFAMVHNDDPVTGDLFQINNQAIDFPSIFHDGGPDYDVFFVDGAALSLRLADSTGTAFSSLDFPLGVPNLAAFDSVEGVLAVSAGDINTGEYVNTVARFRLIRLDSAAAPEPSAFALLGAGLGVAGIVARRRVVCRDGKDTQS